MKSWTLLSNSTFTSHFHALEKETATHSRVLAWRIPGMAEPGGLPSMGSHRVRHDWSDLAGAAAEPSAAGRIKPQVSYFSHSSVPCKEVFLFHFSTSWKCNYKFLSLFWGSHVLFAEPLFSFWGIRKPTLQGPVSLITISQTSLISIDGMFLFMIFQPIIIQYAFLGDCEIEDKCIRLIGCEV